MNFEITKEREAYINSQGNVVLNACPGSGKTTTIAFKINRLIERWEERVGKYHGIACLSFTNVAKDEMEEKIAKFSGAGLRFPHLVSTIDSFINQYITLPYYYLFNPQCKERPQIIDDYSFLDTWNFKYYLSKKKMDGEIYQTPISKGYQPSLIDLKLDGTYIFKGKSPQLEGAELDIFKKYCRELKSRQFSMGLLKNSDATYIALLLLRKYPEIAKMLIQRFPHIIVDEAQDTSEIQYSIFEELIKNGLKNIELIGDPYQSLYEWREARPDLFIEKYQSQDWNKYSFTQCRRSTQTIINCYDKLRSSSEKKIESTITEMVEEPIHVILYNNSDLLLKKYDEISNKYNDKMIVVRGEAHLKQLQAKNVHENFWKISPCLPSELIAASYDIKRGDVKIGVRKIRKCLPIIIDNSSRLDYKKQQEIMETILNDHYWNARILQFITKIPDFNLSLKEWTLQVQELSRDIFQLSCQPDFELKAGKYRGYYQKTISELFQEAPNSKTVTTIHKVKGRTFESLMLVLNENSSGQSISIKDIQQTMQTPNEKTRMVYVGMSRPRWQLVIAISSKDKTDDIGLIKDKFGECVKIYKA